MVVYTCPIHPLLHLRFLQPLLLLHQVLNMLKDKQSKATLLRLVTGLLISLSFKGKLDYTDVVDGLRSLANEIEVNNQPNPPII